jgi:hypothetical protein
MRSAIRVRGHGHWPNFFQALVVDIDDRHRPCGLMAWIDALEEIEGPDADFLDGAGSAARSAANPISSARHSSRA